jgi:DNA topoisomerase-1
VQLKEGRFGPYVTDGETNASLRRADDPATISIERAADLLAERRAKDPAPKKKAAKKAPAKKAAAKKAAAKKTAAKKTAAKA